VTIDLFIAAAERMPVILNERRRYGRITEARMASGIGRRSIGNITACSLDTIVVPLLCSLRVSRWRWGRRVIRRWLRMGAPSKCKGEQQCHHREQFLHDVFLSCHTVDQHGFL
jgi:hypothetical protein